jgi:hypothetical protein
VIDDVSAVVRIDVSTGSQSVVSAGALVGRANGVTVASDGTLLVGTRSSGGGATDAEIVRVDPVSGVQSPQALSLPIGTVFQMTSIRCTDGGGVCVAPAQCSNAADCQDGSFCNGPETCDGNGVCQASTTGDPCVPGDFCSETLAACVQCLADTDCDDGLFCNGAETCDPGGACQAGADPCPAQLCDEGQMSCVDCLSDADCDDELFCNGTETCDGAGSCQVGSDPCAGGLCDEPGDLCLGQDFDIKSIRATGRVRLSSGKTSDVKLTLTNEGGATDVAQLTLTAVQNGNQIFGVTQIVQQDANNGRAVIEASVTPTEVGDIEWTASLLDGDPDVDIASDTTTVLP